jgi:methionyl aminopeptidase
MNVFTPNLPIKKSDKDIAHYLETGPIFGEILKEIYNNISQGKLKNAEEIRLEYRALINKTFFKDKLIPISHEIYPFLIQKNSQGITFPYEICVSVNDCIAHGFHKEDFKAGDIISVDFGFRNINYKIKKTNNSLVFDAAFTVQLGNKEQWINSPFEALREIVHSNPKDTMELGNAIERIADERDVGIVVSLSGHGIGYSLHEAPIIYNAQGKFVNEDLFDGLCFCAEPIFSPKKKKSDSLTKTYLDPDGWAIYTQNKMPSSHFETMYCVIDGQIVDLIKMTEWSL